MDSPENRTHSRSAKFLSKNGTNLKKLLDTWLQKCPFEMVENWINDPTQWPNMDYLDIYHYLVESPSNLSLSVTLSQYDELDDEAMSLRSY